MVDVGEYCRQVEAHLTKVNGGHLVRVVGPGFALVRQWAEEGVPLSAVFRGIEQKAERHHTGASRRPLRIEFCEADVREVYDAWRRAIGVGTRVDAQLDRGSGSTRRSVPRTLDRAVDRLVRVAGRLELPEGFRDGLSQTAEAVIAMRDALKGTRGANRDAVLAPLPDLDRQLVTAARQAAPAEVMDALRQDAERDLAPYRDRLPPDAWAHAMDVTVDRGIREHFGLPTLE